MEINKPISTVLILIIIAVLTFLFVLPKYRESRDMEKQLAQKQAEYESKSAYYEKMLKLYSEIHGREDSLKKISSALPSDISLAPITYFIQNSGDENGILVKSIAFSQTAPTVSAKTASKKEKLGEISFTVDLFGSYQGFKNFLYSLEKSSRLFQLKTVSLAPVELMEKGKKITSSLPMYNFKIDVSTYIR